MITSVSTDTLQGVLTSNKEYLSLVATINGKDYVIGLMDQVPGRPTQLEITHGEEVITYAIRHVAIWRELGSFSLEVPFPIVGFSSLRHQFVVLDEKLTRKTKRSPIVVSAVRLATEDDLFDRSLQMDDDDFMKLLAS